MASTELALVTADGETIAATISLPEGVAPPYPAVIACHGLGSNKSRYVDLTSALSAEGIAALAFDWRGHGESTGCLDQNTLNDVAAILAYLQGQANIDAKRIAILGASMGGHFTLRAAQRFGDLCAAVVICPAAGAKLVSMCSDASYWTGEPSYRFTRFRHPEFVLDMLASDLFAAARQIAPRPVFFIHGEEDDLIPWQQTLALHAWANEPKRLRIEPGAGHSDVRQLPAVHQDIVSWLHGVFADVR